MKELNKLAKKLIGKPMNKEQKEFLSRLRKKVKDGKMSVEFAREVWFTKYNL